MFKISIITVNYNNCIGLKKTIESIIKQDFDLYEFIIIDGGSTDGSYDLIIDYSNKIHYWVSEKDYGIYHAMNKGLEVSKGEYCIFLNSGDYLNDSTILTKVNSYFTPSIDFLYGLIIWENDNSFWNPRKDLRHFELAFDSMIPHQATFFKTKVLKKHGGYKEEFKVISDWGIMIEFLKRNKRTKKIECVVSVCENPGISSDFQFLIKRERLSYLLKYSFSTLVLGYLFRFKIKLTKILFS